MFFRRRNIFIRFFTSQLFITLVLLAILVVLALPVIKDYQQRHKINQEIAILQKKINKIEAENQKFKKMINYLESDQFVEEQARLNLGFKKPGEKVVVVQEEQEKKAAEVEKKQESTLLNKQILVLIANFKKWVDYFFQQHG